MLENSPNLKYSVTRIAPVITAIGIIFGAMYSLFSFYSDAVESHELARSQASEMTALNTTIVELNYTLNLSTEKIDNLAEQMTILASALQYEKDTKEYILLRERRRNLNTQEIIRYCELFRSLKMGASCDI